MTAARPPARSPAALPPGPATPRLLQTLRWVARPVPMTPARGAAVVLRDHRARPTRTQSAPAGSASADSAPVDSAPTGSAPAESSSRRRLRTLT